MKADMASRLARLIALVTPLVLLGGAYVSQYVFGFYPCEMCWWQRYPHFVALGLAIIAWLRPPGRALTALAALAIAVSGCIGAYHAGIEYGWWQGLTACTANLAAHSDNPMEVILNAQVVRCDVAPWSLAGISLAGWNFLFSIAAASAIFLLIGSGKKERL